VPSADPPRLRAVLLCLVMLAVIWAGLVGLLVAAGEAAIHSGALTAFASVQRPRQGGQLDPDAAPRPRGAVMLAGQSSL
jgi:hypothetical protein